MTVPHEHIGSAKRCSTQLSETRMFTLARKWCQDAIRGSAVMGLLAFTACGSDPVAPPEGPAIRVHARLAAVEDGDTWNFEDENGQPNILHSSVTFYLSHMVDEFYLAEGIGSSYITGPAATSYQVRVSMLADLNNGQDSHANSCTNVGNCTTSVFKSMACGADEVKISSVHLAMNASGSAWAGPHGIRRKVHCGGIDVY